MVKIFLNVATLFSSFQAFNRQSSHVVNLEREVSIYFLCPGYFAAHSKLFATYFIQV